MTILPPNAWTSDDIEWEFDDVTYELAIAAWASPFDDIEYEDLTDDEIEELEERIFSAFSSAVIEDLLFYLEQSCDADGKLLLMQMRETKLQTAPLDARRKLEHFIRSHEEKIVAEVAYRAFWIMRIDRARRTGSPEFLFCSKDKD